MKEIETVEFVVLCCD